MRKSVCFLAIIIVMCLAVLGEECLHRQTSLTGSSLNLGANAAWLGVEWVNEPHSDAELVGLARDLNRREIRYIFVFASYRRFDAVLGATYAHADAFCANSQECAPGAKRSGMGWSAAQPI